MVLEEAVAGYAVRVQDIGSAFKIKTTLREVAGHWEPLRATLQAAFLSAESPAQQRFHARCGVHPRLEDLLFVDLETTGLSQTPLFLIGAMAWEGDDLVIRQYLARHYGEESSVLNLFLAQAREKAMLVSFNGKSFDLPYVRMRAITHCMPCALQAQHFDLLHECRRVWRSRLPNCKLQTLEHHVCGHPPRLGDIPGYLIPEAYHAYVRTGNAAQIVQILQHNLLDLVTLAELLTKLPPLES